MTTHALRQAFTGAPQLAGCPIYDMHGHWGPFRGLHIPLANDHAAIAHLRRAGVTRLVLSHHTALLAPETGNQTTLEIVRACPGILRGYLVANPHYPAQAEKDFANWDAHADVFAGLKLHSDMHGAPLDGDGYRLAFEFANARQLPVLVHSWGSSGFSGEGPATRVAERYPGTPLILGHSLHGAWDAAVRIANRFPNVYLEPCAVLDERGILERFIAETGSDRILFGTDFPWYSVNYYLGAVLAACPSEEDARNILYRNARRLLGE